MSWYPPPDPYYGYAPPAQAPPPAQSYYGYPPPPPAAYPAAYPPAPRYDYPPPPAAYGAYPPAQPSYHHYSSPPPPPAPPPLKEGELRPPPDVAQDPNSFRRYFTQQLQGLTFNSKPIITSLTLFAHEHVVRMSGVVAQCMEEHLRTVSFELPLSSDIEPVVPSQRFPVCRVGRRCREGDENKETIGFLRRASYAPFCACVRCGSTAAALREHPLSFVARLRLLRRLSTRSFSLRLSLARACLARLRFE